MPDRATDPDVLGRALGTAVDPRDAVVGEEVRAIATALRDVPVPSAELPGWQSLCATEYAAAVRLLMRELALADGALSVVERTVR